MTLTTATPVGYAADNALTMTATPTNVAVNGTVSYTITVTDYGPSPSTNVSVTDALPSGAQIVSYSTNQGSIVVDYALNQLTWSVGNLTNGGSAALTLLLQPTFAGSFYNYASVGAATADPNPDDNTASTTVTVGTITPPQLSGSSSLAGGTFQFTVSNGQAGSQYIVQASTNLVNWVNVYTNPSYTVPFSFMDTNVGSYGSRFYRVVTGL